MFKNYFKTLLRTMRKNKMHAAINIVGTTVAFACSILLLLMVYNDFSYDNFHANKDKLYKVYNFKNAQEGQRISSSMPYPAAPTLRSEDIGITKSTTLRYGGREVRYNGKRIDGSVLLAENDFLSMFSFPVLNGAQQQQLAQLNSVALTEKTARKIFDKEDPVGKTMEVNIGGQWKSLQVSAVLKDIPDNSSIQFDLLARVEIDPSYAELKNKWDASQSAVYVQLAPNASQQSVEKQLRYFSKKYMAADSAYLKKLNYVADANGDMFGLKLLPLKDIHFSDKLSEGNGASKPFLFILLLVACVIMLIACFNFVNLNIGQSFTRAKEMGMRKCLGASKKQIWLQVWGESLFSLIIAFLLGAGLAIICMKQFNQMFRTAVDTAILANPLVIASLILLLIIVSLLSSGYPSYLLTRLKATEVLKGKISTKKKATFRNALIVAQFVIAIVLICSTIIIYQQFEYLRKAPLGYNTSSLISVPIKDEGRGKEIIAKMRNLLNAQTSIVSISGSDVNFGRGKDGSTSKNTFGFDYGDKAIHTNYLNSDYNIIKTMGMQLMAGRDFSSDYVADTMNNVIVTESVVAQFGIKDPIGFSFLPDSSGPRWHIIGVIPDFHLYSMHEKTEPLTISMGSPSSSIPYLLIRVNTQNPMATMEMIKKAYVTLEPGVEFQGSYVDENVDRWYNKEKQLSKIFSTAAIIAIVLSCMGLFGVSFIIINQRVKEIGVRKVLGASVPSITALVIKEFVKPVVIALLIATPIAVWIMSKWLQNFEYSTSMKWWVFALAGILAIFIAIATVCFQAIKAALTNPVKSLRME